MAGPQFNETEDSIDQSVDNILTDTWHDLKDISSRMRRVMLEASLKHWITEGYVVVPDDYMATEVGEV